MDSALAASDGNQNNAMTIDLEEAPIIDIENDEGYATDSTIGKDQALPGPVHLLGANPDPETHVIYRDLESLRHQQFNLRPGKTVELRDEDFIQITSIFQHSKTKFRLVRGLRFRRNTKLHGLLEKKLNEVSLMLRYDPENPRDVLRQSIETVLLDDIVGLRDLIKTNQPFPALRFQELDGSMLADMGTAWVKDHARLVCRWKFIEYSKNAGCLEVLTQHDSDPRYSMSDNDMRTMFRGETVPGGSSPSITAEEMDYTQEERQRVSYRDPLDFYPPATVDLTDLDVEDHAIGVEPQRRYTLGDAFCGAGGTSRGAKGAGLRVEWGFDFNEPAISSYSLNFTGAQCWAIAAHEFITTVTDDMEVDVLHLSPPCQPFSPAHTRPGQDDEMNEATFFAVQGLLKQIKPRIVTLEETFGLTRTLDNAEWFRAMVQMFTKLGFSVRWEVFDLRNYGLPQPRKRLFIFASW